MFELTSSRLVTWSLVTGAALSSEGLSVARVFGGVEVEMTAWRRFFMRGWSAFILCPLMTMGAKEGGGLLTSGAGVDMLLLGLLASAALYGLFVSDHLARISLFWQRNSKKALQFTLAAAKKASKSD